ncbi:hypothetical protein RhiirA5_420884 [Rhizophagus irregularis]|uniref:Uncharacterized protein n=1 Tax=Rhizophagus irregularis TaxID=588596 RepID=A0A2I1EJ12_9GLOM|nr:hypothetical protein RhiirA5_420884 [Rhizophagus irregularis]PKC60706.1 hypothetical protein RhiirA1_467667 [Rhizophagus irregularis]PKY22123.1 hypothetical protein RhiirB3_435942 [Rhizophagus irregularis]
MTFKLESRIEELEKGRRDTDAENIKRDIEIYELKAKIAKLRYNINELKKESESKKIANFRLDSLMPSSKNIELHWRCKGLSIGFIVLDDNGIFLLEVWYDEKLEIVIPKRIQKIKEFVDQTSKSFDLL